MCLETLHHKNQLWPGGARLMIIRTSSCVLCFTLTHYETHILTSSCTFCLLCPIIKHISLKIFHNHTQIWRAFHPSDQWVLVRFLKLSVYRLRIWQSLPNLQTIYKLKNLPPMAMYLREGHLCLLWDSENICSTGNKMFMSEKMEVNKMITKRRGKDFKTLVWFPCVLKLIWEHHANQSRSQSCLTEVPREFSLLFTRFIPIFC